MHSGKKPLRISPDTKIKALLAVDQEAVIRVLTDLNANFKKLQNPILRKLLAGRVTIADACKVARCPLPDFMEKMRGIGFETEDVPAGPGETEAGPQLFAGDEIVELDVRPMLDAGADPLKQLVQMAGSLKAGQCLRVTAAFSPVPLIALLSRKGFIHATEVLAPDHIRTYFKPGGSAGPPEVPETQTGEDGHAFDELLRSADPATIRTIDVRELEMPQPMLTIMGNLETLPEGEILFVYHKKVPVYFLPQLHEKGYEYLLKRAAGGQVHMLIYQK